MTTSTTFIIERKINNEWRMVFHGGIRQEHDNLHHAKKMLKIIKNTDLIHRDNFEYHIMARVQTTVFEVVYKEKNEEEATLDK